MAIKGAITKKGKSAGSSAQIHQLEAYLTQGYAKLGKIYPKVLADIDKAISRASQEWKKSKEKSKPVKGAKTSTKVKPVNLAPLEKQLEILKAEKMVLQAGHKKLLAQKKAQQQFEKAWIKKSVKPKKSQKKPQSAQKEQITESVFHQKDLIEAE